MFKLFIVRFRFQMVLVYVLLPLILSSILAADDGFNLSKYTRDVYFEMTTTFLYKHDQTAVVYPEEKVIAFNKNTSSNLPESIGYFNATYVQGLQDECQNGTIIRKLLSNPSMTYNISYVDDVIPYFPDVRIYFADGIKNCTSRFKEFIKAKNNILTNIDIYNFLTNDSICWEFAFFTNQLCVEFKLNRYNEVRLSLEVRKHSHMPIHLTLKHQLCTKEFIQYVYRNGLYMGSNDTFILNIDNIINFTQENNCLDMHFPCPSPGLRDMSISMPDLTTAYVQLAIAVEVTFVNTFVLLIFLQKDNRTPVTILLSALAVSDSTAALLMTVPIFIANQIYDLDYRKYEHSRFFILEFPECLVFNLSFNFKYAFHVTSILLTLLLCLQKSAALLFPMWTKQHLHQRFSIKCSVLMFTIVICIYTRISYVGSVKYRNFNGRCCIENNNINHHLYMNHLTIFNVCILLSCFLVALCTVYIICKLTVLRRNLPWTDCPVVQKRNRISAFTVVFICIIFLLSEAPLIFTTFSLMLYQFKIPLLSPTERSYYDTTRDNRDLSLIIGFSLNFIVYSIMSKQLRDKLWFGTTKIARRIKCW